MYEPINPIIFSLGPLSVTWYGTILAMAALVGLLLAVREGNRFGIKPEFFTDLLLIGAPSAIIGARIYYVAFEWDHYRNNFWSVFKIWEGGIAIYGALIAATIAGIIYARYHRYNFWRIADIAAPSLIAGQIIGRWGNFINQEAHGGPVAEEFLRNTLKLPNFIVNQMHIDGTFYHPTFLYESMWNVLGIILLFVIRRQAFVRAGELFMSYFAWYSIGRFYVEGLRTDSLAFAGPEWLATFVNALWSPMKIMFGEPGWMPIEYNLRISQLVALLILVVVMIVVIFRRVRGYANDRYMDPIHQGIR